MDTSKKILIVDDQPDLIEMISFQFEKRGFQVESAKDGLEALDKVHEFKPDLIILDMNMPKMGGIEFYGKICDTQNKPMYPVMVLTARANVQALFKDFIIEGFMIKPFDIDQLIKEAETIIKKKDNAGHRTRLVASRKVCIVDNDEKALYGLADIFVRADFTVIPSKSASKAMEKMIEDVPDVALISLGLTDMAGDFLVLRLSQMAKTMAVKFVLYIARDAKHDSHVMERIADKSGIFTFVEYDNFNDLLEKVKAVVE